jgi:hypothetical protein
MTGYAGRSQCAQNVGVGHGNHPVSWLDRNLSLPGRLPGRCVGVFGCWNQVDQGAQDGHADTARLSRAGLVGPAWPKGWHHHGCSLGCAKSSHPLRSLTTYCWYSLRRIVSALDASTAESSVSLTACISAVAFLMYNFKPSCAASSGVVPCNSYSLPNWS